MAGLGAAGILGVVLAVAVVVLVVFLVATWNALVRLRNKCEEAWSGIDVELQRRADLVPNLVEVVRSYADHERSTFEDVVRARNAAVAARGPVEAEAAENMLTEALQRLFVLAEDYPELQASASFLQLQRQLATIEEDIAFARRYHNAVVEDFNTRIETFPTVLLAGMLGFTRRPFFQADGAARSVPQVSFPDDGGGTSGTGQPPGSPSAPQAPPPAPRTTSTSTSPASWPDGPASTDPGRGDA